MPKKNSTSFKQGVSGNPNGRPKADPAFQQLLMSKQKWALDKLIDIAKSAEDKGIQLKAVQYIIDRGQGKPAQAINLGDADGEKFSIQVIVKQAEVK